MSTTNNYLDVNKKGDTFSVTSKLADYIINPDWKDGFNALSNPNIHNDYKFLWQTISASCEDITSDIYKKITNYINNISNIDTCEIQSLYSFAKMYGYNESLLFTDYSFPTEILELLNIFSINKAYLTGPNSILTYSSRPDIQALSGNDAGYVTYMKDIFYNTLLDFCNMQYREDEIVGNSDVIWESNISKYTTNLFKDDNQSTTDILLKKISLSIPTYFPERRYVDDIQKSLRKITDFNTPEQIILNMEFDRRALARNNLKNISKYSYERENKVGSYIRFITLLADNTYIVEPYPTDIKKDLIVGETLLSLINEDSNSVYSLDLSLIESTAAKLTDLCLKISYIRETMKNQAQKYYMSGTENLIINLIKETLFTTLYNDTNSTPSTSSNYWRYISGNNSVLNQNITSNKDLKIDLIEYTDPVEYFNIATTSAESNSSVYNTRYWENENLYDGDISQADLLEFYNKAGLGNKFTSAYEATSLTGELSAYSLSGFLATIFNSSATSATSSVTSSSVVTTTSTSPITSTYTAMSSGNWDSMTYGVDVSGTGKYIAANSVSGLYSSSDGIIWSKIVTPFEDGWTSVIFGTYFNIYIATNSIHGIYWSSDGIIWTKENSTTLSTGWTSITYSSTLFKYCAVNSIYGIYWSYDGITWTKFVNVGINNGWTSVSNSNSTAYVIASNSIYGLYYTTDCITWAVIDTPVINAGWIKILGHNTGNIFIGINSLSGIYYTSDITTFTKFTTPTEMNTGWTSLAYDNSKYLASHNISGIYYSIDNGANWTHNTAVNNGDWTSLGYTNNKFLGNNTISGLCYSDTGSGAWYPASGTFLTSGGGETTTTSSIIAVNETDKEIFEKYSGNPDIGIIPYANIKNSIHSSYQIHPFLVAFKQYIVAIQGIKNLFTYTCNPLTNFSDIKDRIDNYGNTVNFWLSNNYDFSGYRSQYEQNALKEDDKNLYQDSPFNFDALTLYLNDKTSFINTALSGVYYNHLNLTSAQELTIKEQLDVFYNNIKDLENYSIYRYGKDTFDNVYMLYKKNNQDDERGQLWIRLKNHPIAFPAFISENLTLSDVGQITYTDINTLNNALANTSVAIEMGPLTGHLSMDNMTLTVNTLSSAGLSGTYTTPSSSIILPPINGIHFNYIDESKNSFYTTDLTLNSTLSAYFTSELSGVLIPSNNSVTFSPTLSTNEISSTLYGISFNNLGTILLSTDYLDLTITAKTNNTFSYSKDLNYYDKLNTFYDFGFNFNRDIMYFDYVYNMNDAYSSTNSMFGEIDNLNVDLAGNRILQYKKETNHNLETLPRSAIPAGYYHIDTMINENDIYFIYRNSSIQNSSIKILIFKYNKNDGLNYDFYDVPIKYGFENIDAWRATVSKSVLSICFISKHHVGTQSIGNYIRQNTEELSAGYGRTSFENIYKENSYVNGFTLIQFKIENGLPIKEDKVKYFYKHTDLGFYPQYPGVLGTNKFYLNPEINSDDFYRLQLYMDASQASDFVYEHTFSNVLSAISGTCIAPGIYADMLTVSGLSASTSAYADEEAFLYTTSAYNLCSSTASSEPMKWFRKFDLSGYAEGDYLQFSNLSAGIELSGETLTPSAYVYHFTETDYVTGDTFYPELNKIGDNELLYGIFELDNGFSIKVYYDLDGNDNIKTIYFQKINDTLDAITLQQIGYVPALVSNINIVYTINSIVKNYTITLIDLQKKQFIVERM